MLKKFAIFMAGITVMCGPTAASAQSTDGITKTKFRASNGKNVNIVKNEFTGKVEIEATGSLSSSSWTTKSSCVSGKCETPYAVISVYMDYSGSYSRATLRGGVDISANFGRTNVSSCRNGCTYFQIIILPITEELSAKAENGQIQVMLTGSADDKLIAVDTKGYHAVSEAIRNLEGE